jgi:hypothetical protein
LIGDRQKYRFLIDSIHNYCDRWCERCASTSPCRTYSFQDQLREGKPIRDDTNRIFWQQFSELLEAYEFADEFPRDAVWDEEYGQASFEEEHDHALKDEACRNHEGAHRAYSYMNAVDSWEKASGITGFNDKGHGVVTWLGVDHAHNSQIDAADAFEVIWWYNRFIYDKILRALNGLGEDEDNDLEFQRDCDGSAKVALIAIDRSLSAWRAMLQGFPGQTKPMMQFLVSLAVLRRTIEETFPKARACIRAGFD